MKKILIFFILTSLILSPFELNAEKSVIVSAIVGNINHAPVVLSVTPNSNPRLLKINKTQTYSLFLRDDEKDTLYYNIIPNNGYTNPISGTINPSDYNSSSGVYINFLYLAPAISTSDTITVVINDTSNVISKDLHLTIY